MRQIQRIVSAKIHRRIRLHKAFLQRRQCHSHLDRRTRLCACAQCQFLVHHRQNPAARGIDRQRCPIHISQSLNRSRAYHRIFTRRHVARSGISQKAARRKPLAVIPMNTTPMHHHNRRVPPNPHPRTQRSIPPSRSTMCYGCVHNRVMYPVPLHHSRGLPHTQQARHRQYRYRYDVSAPHQTSIHLENTPPLAPSEKPVALPAQRISLISSAHLCRSISALASSTSRKSIGCAAGKPAHPDRPYPPPGSLPYLPRTPQTMAPSPVATPPLPNSPGSDA